MKAGKNAGEITLEELLGCLILITAGIVGGLYGNKKFGGGLGFIVGFFGGVLLTAVVGAVLIFIYSIFDDLFRRGKPYLPHCSNGRCSTSRDYEVVKLQNSRWAWKCRCGDYYDREGRKFVQCDEQGNCRPYLIWMPFKGWREDTAS